MRKLTKFVTAAVLSMASITRAEAQSTTLDFEQLQSASHLYPSIGNYLGMDFTNFWGLDANAFTNTYGGGYKPVSGNMVAFGRGSTSSFSSTTAFWLNSLWIGSGWNENYPLTIAGYRNGQNIWTRYLNGSMNGATKVDLTGAQDNGLVDEVRFGSSGYEYYIDDVDVLSSAHATPEPVTMALLATGLAGMGGAGALKRRRKSKDA